MQACPCGSGRPYGVCCEPLIRGEAQAATPEELLRSRFSAFALNEVDYVLATQIEQDRPAVEGWSSSAKFSELRILRQNLSEAQATIDFEADYESKGEQHVHKERSLFNLVDGRWLFSKGGGVPAVAAVKVGRNDPCPCGSAKKHKKCCGQ